MTHDVLTRLRAGLAEKRFTLTAVAEAAGIPLTTLDHMRKDGYGDRLQESLNRIEQVRQALDALDTSEAGERQSA